METDDPDAGIVVELKYTKEYTGMEQACRNALDQIKDIIGADSLGYLSCESVHRLADNTQGFCSACFDGNYPCDPPKNPGKCQFECRITEASEE